MLLRTEEPVTYNSISDFWLSMDSLEKATIIKKWKLLDKNDGENDNIDLPKLLHEEGILALLGYWNISDFEIMESVLELREDLYDLYLNSTDDQFYVTKVNPVKNKI